MLVDSREEAVTRHRADVLADPILRAYIRKALRGYDLVCWCAPLSCHADTLLEIANEEDTP